MKESDLQKLEQTIDAAMDACVNRMNNEEDLCDPMAAMSRIIGVMEIAHAKVVGTTILAILEAEKAEEDVIMHPAKLLQFLEACESDFRDNLRHNLARIIKERGLYDIFDPNAAVREEIINESIH